MDVGPGLIQGYTDAGAPKADPERSVAQVSLETAGLPPRSGTLLCVPLNATMDTRRVLSAPDWVANDLPLTYQFGYMYYLGFGPGALWLCPFGAVQELFGSSVSHAMGIPIDLGHGSGLFDSLLAA